MPWTLLRGGDLWLAGRSGIVEVTCSLDDGLVHAIVSADPVHCREARHDCIHIAESCATRLDHVLAALTGGDPIASGGKEGNRLLPWS
jgi:hypothetical protein